MIVVIFIIIGIILGIFVAFAFTFHHIVDLLCRSNDFGRYRDSYISYAIGRPKITLMKDDVNPELWNYDED